METHQKYNLAEWVEHVLLCTTDAQHAQLVLVTRQSSNCVNANIVYCLDKPTLPFGQISGGQGVCVSPLRAAR